MDFRTKCRLINISRKVAWVAGVSAVALAAAGGAYWFLQDKPKTYADLDQIFTVKHPDQKCDLVKRKDGLDCNDLVTRVLSLGEADLVKGVFGEGFAAKGITIEWSRKASKRGVVAQVFNDAADRVYVYGDRAFMADYTKSLQQMAGFMTQMTHMWQARNGIPVPEQRQVYDYKLEAGKKFASYSPSAQGAIMYDYTMIFLSGMTDAQAVRQTAGFKTNMNGSYIEGSKVDQKKLEDFKFGVRDVVEAQFPHAKSYRTTYERRIEHAKKASESHQKHVQKSNADALRRYQGPAPQR